MGDSALDPTRLQMAFDRVSEGVEQGRAPAAVLAVATGRERVRCEAFSRPDGDRVTTGSVFLLASLSKPIVATAVLRLVAEGKLVLSAPITRYIPEFAPAGASNAPAVTAWHLLTHTSGIDETSWPDALRERSRPVPRFDVACRHPLLFEPGARVSYSTLSYELLAALITRLGGVPYQDYLRERVFAPLGMADTSYDPRPLGERVAPVHGLGGGGLADPTDALDYYISRGIAGAGLWSSAADLVAFGQAYLHDARGASGAYRLLPPAYIDLMTREHTTGMVTLVDGRPVPAHYALAWRKSSLDGEWPGSPRAFEHDGAAGGLLWIDPAWDLVFVFLTNAFGAADVHLPQGALQAVYGALDTL